MNCLLQLFFRVCQLTLTLTVWSNPSIWFSSSNRILCTSLSAPVCASNLHKTQTHQCFTCAREEGFPQTSATMRQRGLPYSFLEFSYILTAPHNTVIAEWNKKGFCWLSRHLCHDKWSNVPHAYDQLSLLNSPGSERRTQPTTNLLVAIASISSMKIIEGEFSLASLNTSLTIRGPSPKYFCTNSDPTTLMKDANK